MKTIIFVTGNKGKVKEAQDILGKGFLVKQANIDLDEIQAIDGKEVIKAKTRKAFKILKKPVLVEDTSLYFEAWKGLPGALSRWFLDTIGCEGICKMMQGESNRGAYAESALAFYDGKKMKVVSAKVKGVVSRKPRGKYGFGWDPLFLPDGFEKTFAEMTTKEKSQISMRKLALEKLRKYLTQNS